MRGKQTALHPAIKAPLIAAAFAIAPLAAQAGGEHGASYGHAGDAAEVDRTITVQAKDIDFGHNEIEVQPGETVRFVVKNTGKMKHEFTVGPLSVQKKHRQEMMEMMQSGEEAHGDGDGHSDGHGHANSVMVKPGKTKELIWHFEKVEDVRFGCNVPGHYEAGMHGKFVTSS